MREYDFEGGCLTGVFGYRDPDTGTIQRLGYYYDPDMESFIESATTTIVVAVVLSVLFCICLVCAIRFMYAKDEKDTGDVKKPGV